MKRGTILWCILVLVFIMMVVGCDNEPDAPAKKNPSTENPSTEPLGFPAAKGKLTINGLNSFNDKYVYVQGLVGSSVLVGLTDITGYPSDITYKLVKISGGKAEVPLYMANASTSSYSDSYFAYSGNDTITSLNIIIINESSLKSSNVSNAIINNLGMKAIKSGTFTNGNMTIDWENIDGTWLPSGTIPIQLTENQWSNGNISTSNGEQWFTFNATSYTQYSGYTQFVHVTFGTLTDLYVQIYNSNGIMIGNEIRLYDSERYIMCQVTTGQKYYIKVYPYSGNGSYQIAFNTSDDSPINSSNSIQLTENQWTNGNIPTSSGEQWFMFTATASKQYICVFKGTLKYMYVRIYDGNGNRVYTSSSYDGSGNSVSVILGQKYYIKVYPYSGRNGTYKIAFNTSGASPDAITLTENQWVNGKILYNEANWEWFTFTSTASTQYIHVVYTNNSWSGLYGIIVIDNNGNDIRGDRDALLTGDGSIFYDTWSLTPGQKYYVKTDTVVGGGNPPFTYKIAFNKSSVSPP